VILKGGSSIGNVHQTIDKVSALRRKDANGAYLSLTIHGENIDQRFYGPIYIQLG
jgi:hypothetical protein